jgi:hypothetical protein
MIVEIPRRERLVYRPFLEELLTVKNIADRRKRDWFVIRYISSPDPIHYNGLLIRSNYNIRK